MSWYTTHSTDLELSSSQYWSITDADQTGLAITGDLSISLWAKLESAPGTDVQFQFVSKDGAAGNRGFYFDYQDVSGTKKIHFLACADGTNLSAGTINYTLTVGTWYHVGIIYDASAGSAEAYVNGASIGTISSLDTSIFDSNGAFEIGSNGGGGNYFDGLIGDVRIWSRTITAGEMEDMYTDPATVSNGASLQGWWFLNNTLDTTKAHDNGSNNNDLTNNNTATFSTDTPYHYQTASDTSGEPLDTFTTSSLVYKISSADITGAPIDTGEIGYDWGATSKNSSSWSNLDKSP